MDLDGLEEYRILSLVIISFEKAAPAATSTSLNFTAFVNVLQDLE